MRRWLIFRLLGLGIVATILAGCAEVTFTGHTSLYSALSAQTPLKEGVYEARREPYDSNVDNASPIWDYPGALLVRQGNIYSILPGQSGAEQGSRKYPVMPMIFVVLGPISGYYVVETSENLAGQSTSTNTSAYILIKIEDETVYVAEATSTRKMMADVMYSAFNIPKKDRGLTYLTDDPELNVALLQELIVRYKDKIKFIPFLRLVRSISTPDASSMKGAQDGINTIPDGPNDPRG